MKMGRLKSLAMWGLSVSVLWVVGCTSQEESKPAEEEMTASTVFLRHRVADYSAWRPAYDADAPRRTEAGLQEMGVYRDADDENMVLIVGETHDTNVFKAMVESPDLADKMKEAGVTSEPQVWIGKSLQGGIGTVFLRHRVADYSAWRPIYDADAPRRGEAGLQEMGVYRDVDDENMVLIVWGAEDGDTVKAMIESPDLAEKMKEAGVTSEPQVWMGESQ